jgi:hypothetical protein
MRITDSPIIVRVAVGHREYKGASEKEKNLHFVSNFRPYRYIVSS